MTVEGLPSSVEASGSFRFRPSGPALCVVTANGAYRRAPKHERARQIDRLLSLYVTHDINRLRQVRPIFPAELS